LHKLLVYFHNVKTAKTDSISEMEYLKFYIKRRIFECTNFYIHFFLVSSASPYSLLRTWANAIQSCCILMCLYVWRQPYSNLFTALRMR